MTDKLLECHSGGAAGADYAWLRACWHHSVPSHVFSFEGHRTCTLPRYPWRHLSLHTLTDKELSAGHQPLLTANKTLQRKYPCSSSLVDRLLQRNYMIVRDVGQVFAISTLNKAKTVVSGGTGWGVQMGVDLGLQVYVFDQIEQHWYAWSTMDAKFVEMDEAPIAVGKIAGIGTRQINKAGVTAIFDLVSAAILHQIENLRIP